MTLAELVRTRRLARGWSQEELAAALTARGVRTKQSDISRLERGNVGQPRAARLLALAAVLDLTVGDLLAVSAWGRDAPRNT